VLPLARHPHIDSRVIVFDLDGDPDALLTMDADDIADRLYTPAADLPPGEVRIGLKEVHLNRCPALIAWNHLREEDFVRLGIQPRRIQHRATLLRGSGPALAEKVRRVYATERSRVAGDVDASLYEGFVGDGDKRRLADVRATPPGELATRAFPFSDQRLVELLFRYRARNWPESLTADECQRWDDYRRRRIGESGLSELSLERFRAELTQLRGAHAGDGRRLELLDKLDDWANAIETSLA
jgi:exodeoxyribonuclease-1